MSASELKYILWQLLEESDSTMTLRDARMLIEKKVNEARAKGLVTD